MRDHHVIATIGIKVWKIVSFDVFSEGWCKRNTILAEYFNIYKTMSWHEDICYICFSDFDKDTPRCISYDCIHATCLKCWGEIINHKTIKKCPYCNSKQVRKNSCDGDILETTAGDKVIAPSIINGKYLCRDFVQAQLIKQTIPVKKSWV